MAKIKSDPVVYKAWLDKMRIRGSNRRKRLREADPNWKPRTRKPQPKKKLQYIKMPPEHHKAYHDLYNNRPDVAAKRKAKAKLRWDTEPEFRTDTKRRTQKWFYKDPEHARKVHREYKNKKIKTDAQFHIGQLLRSRINEALKRKGCRKAYKTEVLVGCTRAFLIKHLLSSVVGFTTWLEVVAARLETHHVIPCVHWDLEDPFEQRCCFNWRNMILLTKLRNLQLGDEYPGDLEGDKEKLRQIILAEDAAKPLNAPYPIAV